MRVFPGEVRPIVVEPAKLTEAISQTYGDQSGSAQQIVGDIEGEFDITRMMQELPDVEDLLETEDDAPIIRMINALLTQAVRDGASRHPHRAVRDAIRWCASASTARCATSCGRKRALHAALVSRIKIMAALDIAEKRLPQDGRITLRVGGTPGRRARVDAADRPRRARRAASARQGLVASSSSRTSAWRRMRSTASTP